MSDESTPREVRVRPTVAERLCFAAMWALTPLLLFLLPHDPLPKEWLLIYPACIVGVDQLVRRNGITLTDKEAVIRSPLLNTKRVRWSQVRSVTCEDLNTGRRVVLWTDGDSPTAPPEATPVFLSRKQLDQTFALTREWWLAHGGAGWVAQ
jgi:hypothetical protein